jgi:hypothetical protein
VTTSKQCTVPRKVILDLKKLMSLSETFASLDDLVVVVVVETAAVIHHVVTTRPPPSCDTPQVTGRSIPNFRAKVYMTPQSKQYDGCALVDALSSRRFLRRRCCPDNVARTSFRRTVLVRQSSSPNYIVHLHPVAHCYFTSTFLFRLLCGLLMY